MVGSMRTGVTDRRTDRRTDGAGYIGPAAGRAGGSKNALWTFHFTLKSIQLQMGYILEVNYIILYI